MAQDKAPPKRHKDGSPALAADEPPAGSVRGPYVRRLRRAEKRRPRGSIGALTRRSAQCFSLPDERCQRSARRRRPGLEGAMVINTLTSNQVKLESASSRNTIVDAVRCNMKLTI